MVTIVVMKRRKLHRNQSAINIKTTSHRYQTLMGRARRCVKLTSVERNWRPRKQVASTLTHSRRTLHMKSRHLTQWRQSSSKSQTLWFKTCSMYWTMRIWWVKCFRWHSRIFTTRRPSDRLNRYSTSLKKSSLALQRLPVPHSGLHSSSRSTCGEGMEVKTKRTMITSVREKKNSSKSWPALKLIALKLSSSASKPNQAIPKSWTSWPRSSVTRCS